MFRQYVDFDIQINSIDGGRYTVSVRGLGGDAYILRSILHDWSDAEALQILRMCRQAIADHGKLLVIEVLLAPSNAPDIATWLDLTMLVLLTGRERTEAEFQELYAAAGFRLTRIIRLGGPAIIEGTPI